MLVFTCYLFVIFTTDGYLGFSVNTA